MDNFNFVLWIKDIYVPVIFCLFETGSDNVVIIQRKQHVIGTRNWFFFAFTTTISP